MREHASEIPIRDYEMMVVFAPTVSEEGLPDAVARVSGFVTAQNGEVQSAVHENPWGRRRLAYQIDDHRDAFYVLYRFTAMPDAVLEIEREIKLDETVIRYLLVRYDQMTEHTERVPRERPEAPGGPGSGTGAVPFRRTSASAPPATAAASGAAESAADAESTEEGTPAATAETVEPEAASVEPVEATDDAVESTEPDAAAVEANAGGDTKASTDTADVGDATEADDEGEDEKQ